MLILIIVSLVLAFCVSLPLLAMGRNFLIALIAASVVVEIAVILYSSASGAGLEDPYSIFENVRIVFLCFLGAMFAELVNSLREELKQFAKE